MMKPPFTKCQRGTIVPHREGWRFKTGRAKGPDMANEPRSPSGGGIFIALGAAAGVIVGRLYAQTSIGLIAGVAVGAAIALAMWWRERG